VALGQLDTRAAGVLVNEGGMEGDEVVERTSEVTPGGAQQGKEPGSEILFFGTDDLSGRCKTRQDGKLTDEVVSCKKTKSRRPCSFQRSLTRSEHIACGFCAQDSPVAAETATPTAN